MLLDIFAWVSLGLSFTTIGLTVIDAVMPQIEYNLFKR